MKYSNNLQQFRFIANIPPGLPEALHGDSVFDSAGEIIQFIQPMIQQIPARGFLLMVTSLVALLSLGCEKDQSQAEWWQGEQERIALVHQVELMQYRINQADADGFEEVQKLGKLNQTRTELLKSLGWQRQVLTEEVALLETRWVDLKEATIRNQRNLAIGRTFKSFESASGRKFQDVSVAGIDDAGVTIRHADGSARLRFADLNPEQQVFFGLEADLALAAEEKEFQSTIVYERGIDTQLAAIQAQKSKISEIARSVDLPTSWNSTNDWSRTGQAARYTLTSMPGPLKREATPVGRRSWDYFGQYPRYRYRYRSDYSNYRYVYYYRSPSYNSCRRTITTPRGTGTVWSP